MWLDALGSTCQPGTLSFIWIKYLWRSWSILIYCPPLMYHHKFWVVTKTQRFWMQTVEMSLRARHGRPEVEQSTRDHVVTGCLLSYWPSRATRLGAEFLWNTAIRTQKSNYYESGWGGNVVWWTATSHIMFHVIRSQNKRKTLVGRCPLHWARTDQEDFSVLVRLCLLPHSFEQMLLKTIHHAFWVKNSLLEVE